MKNRKTIDDRIYEMYQNLIFWLKAIFIIVGMFGVSVFLLTGHVNDFGEVTSLSDAIFLSILILIGFGIFIYVTCWNKD